MGFWEGVHLKGKGVGTNELKIAAQDEGDRGVQFLRPPCFCCCYFVTKSCPTLEQTVGHQAPLSMGFSRQEYWSGLLFPSPGDLPNPGIRPLSTALEGRFLYHWATRKGCSFWDPHVALNNPTQPCHVGASIEPLGKKCVCVCVP